MKNSMVEQGDPNSIWKIQSEFKLGGLELMSLWIQYF